MIQYITTVLTLKHVVNDIQHGLVGLFMLSIIIVLGILAWVAFGGREIEDGEECLSVSEQFEPDLEKWSKLLNAQLDSHNTKHTTHVTKCCMNCGVSGANENYLCKPCSKLPRTRLIFNQ